MIWHQDHLIAGWQLEPSSLLKTEILFLLFFLLVALDCQCIYLGDGNLTSQISVQMFGGRMLFLDQSSIVFGDAKTFTGPGVHLTL